MVKNIFNFQCSKNFRASGSYSEILNGKKIFNTVHSVYIHLGVIRVIWANCLFLGQIVVFGAHTPQ